MKRLAFVAVLAGLTAAAVHFVLFRRAARDLGFSGGGK